MCPGTQNVQIHGTQSENILALNKRAIAHYCKIVGQELENQCKTCSHKKPVLSLVTEYKVEGYRYWARIFGIKYLEKSVFSLELYPGLVLGH